MAPTVAFPPVMPLTCQVTAVFVVPFTFVVNWRVLPTSSEMFIGSIVIVTGFGLGTGLPARLASGAACALKTNPAESNRARHQFIEVLSQCGIGSNGFGRTNTLLVDIPLLDAFIDLLAI